MQPLLCFPLLIQSTITLYCVLFFGLVLPSDSYSNVKQQIESSDKYPRFIFILFIILILTHSSIKWILDQKIFKILPAWIFYVPQIDGEQCTPQTQKTIFKLKYVFQNFKPNSYCRRILSRFLHLTTWVRTLSF